jgi:hypothetical protein
MGIHLGMDSQTTHAGISVVAASNNYNSYINFCVPGNSAKGSIIYNNPNNYMYFNTVGLTRVMIDESGGLVIGSLASTAGAYKLKVIGSCYLGNITGPITIAASGLISAGSFSTTGTYSGGIINGTTMNNTGLLTTANLLVTGGGTFSSVGTVTLATSGSKNFDIKHPLKEGYRLRHRCIEGPEAYLFYHFQYHCKAGFNEFEMPDYFDVMNTNVLVYVSPYKHFGAAWGETKQNTLTVCCSIDGTYNIQVIGTRNDQIIQDDFSKFGVEYPEELLSQ